MEAHVCDDYQMCNIIEGVFKCRIDMYYQYIAGLLTETHVNWLFPLALTGCYYIIQQAGLQFNGGSNDDFSLVQYVESYSSLLFP